MERVASCAAGRERSHLAAFGEDLRRAREERGVAVEAICEATKVSPKHIRALEAGEFADMPGGVFRRGFVRSYLRVLGLDEGDWMPRFEQSCREIGMGDPAGMEWATFAENVKNSRGVSARRAGFRRLALGLLVVLLALAGWTVWRVRTHRSVLPRSRVSLVLNSWVDNGASR
jgi:cytoskeleton protein RodZ